LGRLSTFSLRIDLHGDPSTIHSTLARQLTPDQSLAQRFQPLSAARPITVALSLPVAFTADAAVAAVTARPATSLLIPYPVLARACLNGAEYLSAA
jgi:hypothetical protein